MEREKPFIAEEFLGEIMQLGKTILKETALGGVGEDKRTQQLTYDALESQAEHLINVLDKNIDKIPPKLLEKIVSELEALKLQVDKYLTDKTN